MPLVPYHSSSSEDESEVDNDNVQGTQTHDSAPPVLPAEFHDLYPIDPRRGDDPAFHQGRDRIYKHVVGTFPTHIYASFRPSPSVLSRLRACLVTESEGGEDWQTLLESDNGVPRELHLSLSRHIPLQSHQRHAFTDALQDSISTTQSGFTVHLDRLEIVNNETLTRTFLVLSCRTSRALYELYSSVETILKAYDFPIFHNPKFHVSIAWQPRDASTTEFQATTVEPIELEITEVKIKVGNAVTSIPLSPHAA